jgi:hypothetical protein
MINMRFSLYPQVASIVVSMPYSFLYRLGTLVQCESTLTELIT